MQSQVRFKRYTVCVCVCVCVCVGGGVPGFTIRACRGALEQSCSPFVKFMDLHCGAVFMAAARAQIRPAPIWILQLSVSSNVYSPLIVSDGDKVSHIFLSLSILLPLITGSRAVLTGCFPSGMLHSSHFKLPFLNSPQYNRACYLGSR
ncbi:hypothetical protein CHARACLAT_010920 [Characodon lateralis]|uniref:Secreted protein n=1 Tax=Characodon lateralis TaxID=208331 RepID=A0ABU7DQ45_9TELE|nr:hypothetical protein [Characodon lateralis]